MNKKVFRILTFIVMILSCVCFSACSNKYEKFKFEISYAFSEDATEWNKVGDGGILLNYGAENDELVFNNNTAIIYVKVNIKGVKSKYLDDIIVSKDAGASGENLNFSSTIVKRNKVFPVSVSGGVSTTLKFYETKSGKQTKVDLNIFQSLNSIEVKTELGLKSVFEGGTVNLAGNITYLPENTNQTGVVYTTDAQNVFIDENGVLRVGEGFQFGPSNHTIVVTATSIHNPEIKTTFKVAVLKKPSEYVNAKFYNNNTEGVSVESETIYPNSTRFATTSIMVDYPTDAVYVNGVVIDGVVYKYQLQVYIDGVLYDFESAEMSQGYNGLIVRKDEDLDNVVHITAMSVTNASNRVKFVWNIKGFESQTSSETYSKLSKEIIIKKRMLPTSVMVDGDKVAAGVTDTGVVYATTSKTYKGLKLNLEASPLDVNSNAKVLIVASGLVLSDSDGNILRTQIVDNKTCYAVESGSDVYFNFETASSNAFEEIQFLVKNVPETFGGESVTAEYEQVSYKIKKFITADKVSVYDNAVEELTKNVLMINKSQTTNFKLKVEHSVGDLVKDTIILKSSNSNILFSNGKQEISLSHNTINGVASSGSTLFTVPLIANNVEEEATITVVAGEESVGVGTTFTVKSVATTKALNVSVESEDTKYFNDKTEDVKATLESTDEKIELIEQGKLKYFAIIQNQLVDFEVLFAGSADGIYDISVNSVMADSYTVSNNLSCEVFSGSNKFNVSGSKNATQVLKVTVYYYAFEAGRVVTKSHDIELEIATCSAIASIKATASRTDVAYINSIYKEVQKVEIQFTSADVYNGSPTETIVFRDGLTLDNIGGVVLSISNIAVNENNVKLSLITNDGEKELENVKNAGKWNLALSNKNVIDGKIILELEGPVATDEIELYFTPKFSNIELTPTPVYITNARNYEKATKITLDNITENAETGRPEIYSSFFGVEENGSVQVSFGAKAQYSNADAIHYDDLDFIVYEIQTNENGVFVEDENGNLVEKRIVNFLNITIENDIVTVKADKELGGGYFRIQVVANDSFDDNIESDDIGKKYTTSVDVYFRLADGTKKNKYLVTSEEDLYKINKDLYAHYVLGANINIKGEHDPIGSVYSTEGETTVISDCNPFMGSLSGAKQSVMQSGNTLTTRYTITLTVKNSAIYSVQETQNTISGLFARLGAGSEISDLNIYATFNTAAIASTAGETNIGALAGENNGGTIRNVNVTICNTAEFANIIDLNFGAIVGKNAGTINLVGSEVVTDGEFEISLSVSNLANIGAVVGKNEGVIYGHYQGKTTFNKNVVFSTYTHINITNKLNNENIYIGGVAGSNDGEITGVITSGKISVKHDENITTQGYLAGVAGRNIRNGEIVTNAVMGLNLDSTASDVAVAGVVGYNSAILTDVRVIAVNVLGKLNQTTGKISATGIVAGIVAENTANISWLAIESFIDSDANGTFYMLNSSAETVAGLVYNNTATVSNSFVNANIGNCGNTVYSTVNGGTNENTYFVGKVSGYDANENTVQFDNANSTSYAVIVLEEVINNTNVVELGQTSISGDVWAKNENLNYVDVKVYDSGVLQSTTRTGYPHLIKNGIPFMIEVPTDLQTSINQDYVTEIDSNYISGFDWKEYSISETVIVNFKDAGDNNYKLYNTHLISDLISETVIPENAQGGIRYEIVAGSNFARLEDGDDGTNIIFMGVSRAGGHATPIVVRCYSLFNGEIEKYVAIFTELGVTNISLVSTSIVERNDEQHIYTYVGSGSIQVGIVAENIGANKFDTIFDSKNSTDFMEIEILDTEGNAVNEDILSIDLSDVFGSGIKFKVKEDAAITESETMELVVKLNMNVKNFLAGFKTEVGDDFDLTTLPDVICMAQTDLKFVVFESATGLEIVEGGDKGSYQTDANIGFKLNLLTSYVNDNVNGVVSEEGIEKTANVIKFNETDKDSLSIVIEVKDGKEEVKRLLEENNCSLAELFNISAGYEAIKSSFKTIGYTYNIELSLREVKSIRYIENPILLNVTFMAASNNSIQSSVEIELKPTQLSTVRMEHYSAKTVTANTTYTDLITKSFAETSIIAPGGNGGVLAIYLTPEYSYVENVVLTSLPVFVMSENRDFYVDFTQLVQDENGNYVTLYKGEDDSYEYQNSEGIIEKGINISLVSSKNARGEYSYTGVIYIHTRLARFAGTQKEVDIKLSVDIGEGKTVTSYKTLYTTYVPGASLSYLGAQNVDGTYKAPIRVGTDSSEGYLIQNKTSYNIVEATTYGYSFASPLSVSFEWWLNENNKYTYKYVKVNNLTEEEFNNRTECYYLENGTYKQIPVDARYEEYKDNFYIISSKTEIYRTEDTGFNSPLKIGNFVRAYNNYHFEDLEPNKDGSYTCPIQVEIKQELVANFRMNVSVTITNANNDTISTSSYLNFYPTNYIYRDAIIKELVNNKLEIAMNSSSLVSMLFTSDSRNTEDISEEMYQLFLEDFGLLEDVVSEEDVNNFKNMFSYGSKTFADDSDFINVLLAEFKQEGTLSSKALQIVAKNEFNTEVEFEFKYAYQWVDGMIELHFGNNIENSAKDYEPKPIKFTLKVFPYTTEKTAIPIRSGEELIQKLATGADFILLNDIELSNLTPITTAIASLDGNGHVIKIKSFAVSDTISNYGLFGTLGTYEDKDGKIQKSILKNVIVDYSEVGTIDFTSPNPASESDETYIQNVVFGGIVANNNGGLIYNSDVINNSSTAKTVTIKTDNNSKLTFGGLVGINNGIITNSRVGRSEYTKYRYSEINGVATTSTSIVRCSSLTFVLGDATKDENGFKLSAGAFVGENSGTISSSYVSNTSLISYAKALNTASEPTNTMLAGFVANNLKGANIMYSYVRAESESNMASSTVFSTGSRIQAIKDARVAGFVYTNAGEISNSFANIELVTESNYAAGFVDNNSGTISEAYAAATINGTPSGFDISERPFTGEDSSSLSQNTGVLENVYFVTDNENKVYENEIAQAYTEEAMTNSSNLLGFVFVLSEDANDRDKGVWSYYGSTGTRYPLPQLVSANQVAESVRVLVDDGSETGEVKYKYLSKNTSSGEPGSKTNPHIIRNADEFNAVFNPQVKETDETKEFVGYVRFINDIEFGAANENAIQTRSNFTLGAEGSATIIDGNGMRISDIYIDAYGSSNQGNVGLFSQINNAYIKNLQLEFVSSETSTLNVTAVGGLAGTITNSAIFNVKLNGNDVTLQASNFAGGLAGIVQGNSIIYGVSTNLSTYVDSTSESLKLYSSSGDKSTYSYAGGLAGVLDLTSKKEGQPNIQFVDVIGGTSATRSATADFAGGFAGYASSQTYTKYSKYHIEKSTVYGKHAVGGLYAVNLGTIEASQVAAMPVEKTQYGYDTVLAEYILAEEFNLENSILNESKIGNTKLLETKGYAGGLVGLSIKSNILACYAKASFVSGAKVGGGLLGVAIGGSTAYSYAVPYLQQSNGVLDFKYFGGLVGVAWNNETLKDELKGFAELVDSVVANIRTNVETTFATVLTNIDSYESKTGIIDYLCTGKGLTYNGASILSNTYVAKASVLDNVIGVANSYSQNIKSEQLSKLYDKSKASSQANTFDNIFSSWNSCQYWSLNSAYYYPLLKDQVDTTYIEIWEADDFKLMKGNQTGSFKVMQNIDMTGFVWDETSSSNFIIPIDFEGTLVGALVKDSEGNVSRVKISNLNIKADTAGNAGFFKTTKNAKIMDLVFEWQNTTNAGAIDLNGKNLASVGAVSPHDENSSFNNLTVKMINSGGEDYPYFIKDETGATISTFGGIIGEAFNSSVIGCSFNGSVKYTVGGSQDTYFGGIVGVGELDTSKVEVSDNPEIILAHFNASGVSVGGDCKQDQSVKIDLKVAGEQTTNIGIVYGSMKGTALTNTQVGSAVELGVELDTTNGITANIAGFAGGITDDTFVENIEVNKTKLTVKGGNTNNTVTAIGGLIGLTSGETEINDVFANALLDLTSLDTATLHASSGVAKVAGSVTITNSMFAGTIDSENELNSLKTVVAGGVAGYVASTSTISLESVMSTTEIKIGSKETNKIVIGGLIGGCDETGSTAIITNSVGAGRIIPITSNSEDCAVYVGGVVGKVNSLTANYVYTLTSILTDSVQNNVVDNTLYYVNAVAGLASSNSCTELYYSSDYALCTDSIGTNLVGSALVGGTLSSKFITNNSSAFGKITNAVPYLVTLTSELTSLGIIEDNAGTGFSYVAGTAFNPSSFANYVSDEEFRYYKYENTTPASLSSFKGILIGWGTTEYDELPQIKEVQKHSAVSNIHINKSESVTLTQGADGVYGGVVITNNGVVYNCSWIGREVNLTAGAITGFVVGNNLGVVSACFSTVEATEINNSVTNIGGVVGQNNGGLITTSYFTGYINNSANQYAGGIVGKLENAGYIYNCYSAGVIVTENMNGLDIVGNSFVGNLNGKSITGANNYLDSRGGVETKTIDNVNITATTKIMTMETNLKGFSSALLVNGTQFSGKNYGYPVVALSKYDNNLTEIADYIYNEDTGTGKSNVGSTVTERYNAIYSTGENGNYDSAIKIPHLGVLSVIGSIGEGLNYVIIYDIDGKNVAWSSAPTFSGVIVSDKYLNYKGEVATISNLDQNGLLYTVDADSFIADINFAGAFNLENSGVVATKIQAKVTINQADVTIKNVTFDYKNGANSQFVDVVGTGKVGGLIGTIENNSNVTIMDLNTKWLRVSGNEATVGVIAGTSSGAVVIDCNCITAISTTLNLVSAEGDSAEQTPVELYSNNPLTINIGKDEESYANVAGGLIGEMNGGSIKGSGNQALYLTYGAIYANNFGGVVGNVNASSEIGVVVIDGDSNNNKINVQITKTVNGGDNKSNSNFFGLIASQISNSLTVNKLVVKPGIEFKVSVLNGGHGDTNYSDTCKTQGVGGLVGKQVGNLTATMAVDKNGTDYAYFNVKLDVTGVVNTGGVAGVYESGTTNITGWDASSSSSDGFEGFEVSGTTNVGGLYGRVDGELFKAVSYEQVKTKPTNWTTQYFNYFKSDNSRYTKDDVFEADGTEKTFNQANCYVAKLESNINTNIYDKAFAKVVVKGNLKSNDKYNNFGGLFGVLGVNIYEVYKIGNDFYSGEIGQVEDQTVLRSNNAELTTIIKNNNEIVIGEKDSTDTDRNKNVYVAYNVGGIAGNATGSYYANLKNNGNIKHQLSVFAGAQTEDDTNVYYGDFSLSVRTVNVGGVFGSYSNGDIRNLQSASETIIEGYQNVGGVIGYLSNIQNYEIKGNDSEPTVLMDFVEVHGSVNVGGYFGCLNTVKIKATGWPQASQVFGTTNVGGLAGIAYNSEISEVQLKYTYIFAVYEHAEENVVIIPTGVGGFVGRVEGEVKFTENILKFTQIYSAKEGVKYNERSTSINTINNYMHGKFDSDLTLKNDYSYIKNNDIILNGVAGFNELESGFGGFVGTLNYDTYKQTCEDGGYAIKTNTIQSLVIQAPLGINVGLFYGFIDANYGLTVVVDAENYKTVMLITPKLAGFEDFGVLKNYDVSGGYNIGGVAGFVKFNSSSELSASFSSSDIQALAGAGNYTIYVQNSLPGMYVGGLFGKLRTNNASAGLTLKNSEAAVKIEINTSSSYYVGGLVGKWDAIGSSPEFKGMVGSDATDLVTNKGIKDISSASEFGGMIGLLKLDKEAGSVTVTGTHYYPFTVNTVENSNYHDGESYFDVNETEDATRLIANAYYVNKDNISICATKNVPEQNLLNPLSYGWHKTYTGFKQMQRSYDNERGQEQAISVVYNAEYITYVEARDLDGDGNKEIIYTIYEEEKGVPIMYSRVGIAKVFSNIYQVGGEIVDYPVNIENGYKDAEGNEKDWYYIDASFDKFTDDEKHQKDLYNLQYYYFRKREDDSKTFRDGDISYEDGETDVTCYYSVDKFLDDNEIETGDRKEVAFPSLYNGWWFFDDTDIKVDIVYMVKDYLGQGDQWFIFETVYTNESMLGEQNDSYLPEDGSIFNVSGVQNLSYKVTAFNWLALVQTVGTILLISAALILDFAVLKGFGMKFLVTFAKTYATLAHLAALATSLAAVAAFMGSFNIEYYTSQTCLMDAYMKVDDRNYGYLTGGRSIHVKYDENNMFNYTVDDFIYIEDNIVTINDDGTTDVDSNKDLIPYYFYSSQKPSDIYESYYTGINSQGEIKQFSYKSNEIEEIEGCQATFKASQHGETPFKAYKTYIYKDGAYYFYPFAGKLIYQNEQMNLDVSKLKRGDINITPAQYYIKNDIYYLAGENGNTYANTFDVNTYGNQDNYISVEQEFILTYDKGSKQFINPFVMENSMDRYDYVQYGVRMVYEPNVVRTSDGGNVSIVNIGTLKKVEDASTPTGVLGGNYHCFTTKDGEKVYYQIISSDIDKEIKVKTGTEGAFNLSEIKNAVENANSKAECAGEYKVYLYPGYDSSIDTMNSLGLFGNNREAVQFWNTRLFNDLDSTKSYASTKQDVKYFKYEGGYYLLSTGENGYYNTDDQRDVYHYYDQTQTNGLNVYEKITSLTVYTEAGLKFEWEGEVIDKMLSTYKKAYPADPSKWKTEVLDKHYLVDPTLKIDGQKIYEDPSMYSLYTALKDKTIACIGFDENNNGIWGKVISNYYYNNTASNEFGPAGLVTAVMIPTEGYSNLWKNNAYLTNETYGVYTRFKYTDHCGEVVDFVGDVAFNAYTPNGHANEFVGFVLNATTCEICGKEHTGYHIYKDGSEYYKVAWCSCGKIYATKVTESFTIPVGTGFKYCSNGFGSFYWLVHSYSIIPDSNGSVGKAGVAKTYFVESARVTLGGGKTLTKTGTGTVKAGTISVT